MKRSIASIFLFNIAAVTLTACQTTPTTSIQKDGQLAVLMQQIDNLDATPTTMGNSAKLFKLKSNCLIEFTGVHQTGTVKEYWSFKNQQLLSAYTTTQSPSTAQISQRHNFNIQDRDIQQNFATLSKHFDAEKMQQCQF